MEQKEGTEGCRVRGVEPPVRCRAGDGLLFNGDSKTTLISNATSVSDARASPDCSVLTILVGILGRRENRQPLSTNIVGNL